MYKAHKNIPGLRLLAVCMDFYLTPDVKGLLIITIEIYY